MTPEALKALLELRGEPLEKLLRTAPTGRLINLMSAMQALALDLARDGATDEDVTEFMGPFLEAAEAEMNARVPVRT